MVKVFKRFLVLVFAVLTGTSIFLFGGCNTEKDPRLHITMLVYDMRDSETYLCELTEENPKAEITLEYRMEGYEFDAKAKFPDGRIEGLINKNAIQVDTGRYISPNGEEHNDFLSVWERGTYEYRFWMLPDNERAFPFNAYLTIHIV